MLLKVIVKQNKKKKIMVLVKFILKPDTILNISSKSESTWAELISAKSASLMGWLMNHASFRFQISIILSPTHRLLNIGASLCVFNLLCSPPIWFFSIILRGEYKNWIFWLVKNLIKWSFIHPARVKLLSLPFSHLGNMATW